MPSVNPVPSGAGLSVPWGAGCRGCRGARPWEAAWLIISPCKQPASNTLRGELTGQKWSHYPQGRVLPRQPQHVPRWLKGVEGRASPRTAHLRGPQGCPLPHGPTRTHPPHTRVRARVHTHDDGPLLATACFVTIAHVHRGPTGDWRPDKGVLVDDLTGSSP